MSQVARNARTTAKPGRGQELAELLLGAAQEMSGDPGCELYLISRQTDDPDIVWVTELWRSQADLDACVQRIRGSDAVSEVMALVEASEMIELDLLGGKGAGVTQTGAPGGSPHTIRTLTDAEDAAAKHGMSAMGEARFPNEELGTQQTGLSHHRLRAGARQPFGHRHENAEEVYVVLSGSGRSSSTMTSPTSARSTRSASLRPWPAPSKRVQKVLSCSPSARCGPATASFSRSSGRRDVSCNC